MKYDICVFGGCSIDKTFYADEHGNYKDTPDILVPGGKGSNQAVAASRAGANVTIITRIGKDETGREILDNLIYNGIHTNNVEQIEGLNNDQALIYIDEKTKDNEIKRVSGAIDSFTKDMIDRYKTVLKNSKLVLAQMKIPKEVSIELINFCYENNIPIIITPCRPQKLVISDLENKKLVDKISIITCNEKECKAMFETDNIESCVEKYPNKLIVTLGENGVIYNNGIKTIHLPAIKAENIEDTTGAGDTFNGNLAAYLVEGELLPNAIYKAQFASSMKIRVKTAQAGMPYKDDLEEFIRNTQYGTNNEYKLEYDLALSAINHSVKIIKKNKIFKIETKSDNTFVTDIDKLIEKTIIDDIKNQFPDDTFITEEYNPHNKVKNRTWVLDPIDGTAHFMKQSIFWGIQLAFLDKNEVAFAIIYIPKLNEMYTAIKGKGAFLNNIRLNINNYSIHESNIEICGAIKDSFNTKKELLYKMQEATNSPANIISINSCSFAFANLFANRTNALIPSTKNIWDVLPGTFIAEEAGINTYSYSDVYIFSNCKELDKLLINKD